MEVPRGQLIFLMAYVILFWFLICQNQSITKLLEEICKVLGEVVLTLIKGPLMHRDDLKFILDHQLPGS